MKKYILGILSLVLLSACNSFEEPTIENAGENNTATTEKYFVYANINNTSDTRVDITPSTNANGKPIIKVNWAESGEQFLVYRDSELSQPPYNATAHQFSQVSGNQFTGNFPINNTGYSAFYNCLLNLNQSGPSTFTMDYDMSEQNGTGDKVLMMGKSKEGTGVIDFDHLGFILKLTFKYKNEGMNDWEVLNSSIAKIEMGGDLQYVNDEDSKEQITVTPTSALDDIYIFLPKLSLYPYATQTNSKYKVQYNAGDTFTFRVTTSDNEYTGSLTLPASPTLEAGKFYTATIKLTNTRSYLPEGTEFKDQLVNFVGSRSVKVIKFVPNSPNTTKDKLTGITGSPAYFVMNGNTVEIHSAAETFVFDSDCSNMFSGSSGSYELLGNITSIDFAECCDTSNVTNMQAMFSHCRYLHPISGAANFDTTNVTNMCQMFLFCGDKRGPFEELINMSKFDTSNVTNMEEMFKGYYGTTLDVSSFEMSNVTNAKNMFIGAFYLNKLKLGKFDIPENCDLTNMFFQVGLNNNSDNKAKIYVSNQTIIERLKNANTGIDSSKAEILPTPTTPAN